MTIRKCLYHIQECDYKQYKLSVDKNFSRMIFFQIRTED